MIRLVGVHFGTETYQAVVNSYASVTDIYGRNNQAELTYTIIHT